MNAKLNIYIERIAKIVLGSGSGFNPFENADTPGHSKNVNVG